MPEMTDQIMIAHVHTRLDSSRPVSTSVLDCFGRQFCEFRLYPFKLNLNY